MEDERIIELYFARSESAIAETDRKYGAACRLCMAEQTPVSFDDYDYVTMVYCTGTVAALSAPGKAASTLSAPFYAFYKDIGESPNGNRIFARTLVPAVAVSGLDDYFERQQKEHAPAYADTVPLPEA